MSGKKILVIEDERDLVKLLKYNLEKEGFEIVAAYDGEAGIVQFKKEKPDIVLLDLMMPKLDGIEVCKLIRKESQVPILMLTAKKSEVDKILGLELGADDYITKPFSVREVVARVKSVARRLGQKNIEVPSRIGSLEVDFNRHEVKVNGQTIRLRPKEFDLLRALIQANGHVLSREDLLKSVWGHEEAFDIDTRTVDQHIARMRVKLKPESRRIVTVHNLGYKIKID